MRLKCDSRIVHQTQMSVVLLLSVLLVGRYPISAQTPPSAHPSIDVLKTYRKMDAEGGRLTPNGWNKASKYFVKPGQWLPYKSAVVIWGETDPYSSSETPSSAKLSFRCVAVGQIDSGGNFTYAVNRTFIDSSGRRLKRQPETPEILGPDAKLLREYDLVFTDTYWEFAPGGKNLREVKGPPAWRIAHFEYQPWITIQTAIRYLTQRRNESSDEKVKSNADKSIATLQRLLTEHK